MHASTSMKWVTGVQGQPFSSVSPEEHCVCAQAAGMIRRSARTLAAVGLGCSSRCFSTKNSFDAIVVGVGSHGSACLYHLAKSGAKVLGIERYSIAHTQGSHHGHTRITRQAYLEGAAYVPLLKRSFNLYGVLEQETRQTLFHRTGCLNIGDPACSAALASARTHSLPHELLSGTDINQRFPGYALPPDLPVLYEEAGGFLQPEAMIQAHVEVARRHGATVHTFEQVLGWEAAPGDTGVTVVTDKGSYSADKLVLTGGAWMHKLVPELQGLSQPGRTVVGWFQAAAPQLFQPSTFPVFIMQDPATRVAFYGFPEFGGPGVKVGIFGVSSDADPDTLDRDQMLPSDEQPLRAFMERYLPQASGPLLRSSVCMFVMTPDGHFIIDQHPRHPQVILCSACSGHGFKLSPAIGSALADMLTSGACREFEQQLQQHKLSKERPGHEAVLSRFAAV